MGMGARMHRSIGTEAEQEEEEEEEVKLSRKKKFESTLFTPGLPKTAYLDSEYTSWSSPLMQHE
jgi:hypothetical protein